MLEIIIIFVWSVIVWGFLGWYSKSYYKEIKDMQDENERLRLMLERWKKEDKERKKANQEWEEANNE